MDAPKRDGTRRARPSRQARAAVAGAAARQDCAEMKQSGQPLHVRNSSVFDTPAVAAWYLGEDLTPRRTRVAGRAALRFRRQAGARSGRRAQVAPRRCCCRRPSGRLSRHRSFRRDAATCARGLPRRRSQAHRRARSEVCRMAAATTCSAPSRRSTCSTSPSVWPVWRRSTRCSRRTGCWCSPRTTAPGDTPAPRRS